MAFGRRRLQKDFPKRKLPYCYRVFHDVCSWGSDGKHLYYHAHRYHYHKNFVAIKCYDGTRALVTKAITWSSPYDTKRRRCFTGDQIYVYTELKNTLHCSSWICLKMVSINTIAADAIGHTESCCGIALRAPRPMARGFVNPYHQPLMRATLRHNERCHLVYLLKAKYYY